MKSITKIVEEIPQWIKTLNKYIERVEKLVDVEKAYFEHSIK